ncbi:MAG: CBS domain-containing protein [Reyranella sp.]|uniref:CBS domain-containing protein n=1 Tax=Reyranella sp. TaxID=1929291 RepID=UPI001AD528CA|nr:CBS domain-containing protein [Reyranella sp.]MBN9091206.1 CBS domain-containing protein [Reyranella sp.]
MFVSDILSQKGGLVFTVSPGTILAQIAQQLSVRRIGSVLIMADTHRVAGIVSERDIVRAMADRGAGALELEAREVMTREVQTCHPDDSIEHVMEMMTRGRFRHLPVVDHGELIGLISIGDVVKARLEETRHETEALKAYISAG